jgi:outer membrane protein OmpA-like peptidoglycan-associated protein
MAINLIESVKDYFTGSFCNQAANSLDETGNNVHKAISAIIPVSFAAMIHRATSGSDGASTIFNMAKSQVPLLAHPPNISALHNDEAGSEIPSRLLGNHESQVTDAVSRYAGIKNSSAAALMTASMPAIAGFLGRHAETNNLSPSGLSGFLSSIKDQVAAEFPPHLASLGALFGLGAPNTFESAGTAGGLRDNLPQPPKSKKWLLPLIIILAVIALLIFLSKSCNDKRLNNSVPTDTNTTMRQDTGANVRPTNTNAASIQVKLPNGKVLDAYKGGIEDQLVTFLNGNWKSLSEDSLKNRWFNFDNLNFNTGNAILLPSSEKQLDNIAEILKAYPDVKIKIGGYTDATGNATQNKKLSQERADAAKNGLDKRGVGRQVIGAEGYGSAFAQFPPTASDAEKALDRHVSVSVRKT